MNHACNNKQYNEHNNKHIVIQIRLFAQYLNAIPQCMEFFSNLQREFPPERIASRAGAAKLRLLQDVKTRWNSTCLMLIRSIRLRNAITAYHSEGDVSKQLGSLELRNNELELAEYLLVLTYPFAIEGYTICAETHPTINLV